jgi:hypothetical protein
LAKFAVGDSKWREVMLFTVGLMPSADQLLLMLIRHLNEARGVDAGVLRFLAYNRCQATISDPSPHNRFSLIFGRYNASDLEALIQDKVSKQKHPPLSTAEISKIGEQLARINAFVAAKEKKYDFGVAAVIIRQCHFLVSENPNKAASLLGGYFARPDNFIGYLNGCQLVIECIEVAVTHKRSEVLSSIMSVDEHAMDVVARDVGYI